MTIKLTKEDILEALDFIDLLDEPIMLHDYWDKEEELRWLIRGENGYSQTEAYDLQY